MKTAKITTIICLIIMFAIGAGTLAVDNKASVFCESENRMLEGIPEVSLENILSGDFSADFEKYMIDRIPFRNSIINIKDTISQSLSIVTLDDAMNLIDTNTTQQMEGLGEEIENTSVSPTNTPAPTATNTNTPHNPDAGDSTPVPVTATPDPNMFNNSKYRIIGFSENDTDTITALARFNTKDVIAFADILNKLSSLLPGDGNLIHVSVLESRKARPMLSSISNGKDISIVDETVEVLEYYAPQNTHIISSTLLFEEPLKNQEKMYFFTDPHWSIEGAYCTYRETMNQIGINPVDWNSYNIAYEYPFRGAYYKKSQTSYFIENPDTLAIINFTQATEFTHYLGEDNIEKLPIIYLDAVDNDRYRVYFDGPKSVGPLSVIETTSQTGRNALVILDSYGLSFSTMLIPHYDNICLMDLRYMYKSTEKYYISDIAKKYDVDDIYVIVGDLNAYGTFYPTLIDQHMDNN